MPLQWWGLLFLAFGLRSHKNRPQDKDSSPSYMWRGDASEGEIQQRSGRRCSQVISGQWYPTESVCMVRETPPKMEGDGIFHSSSSGCHWLWLQEGMASLDHVHFSNDRPFRWTEKEPKFQMMASLLWTRGENESPCSIKGEFTFPDLRS